MQNTREPNFQAKLAAAGKAVELIESGMNVGLGTGSTASIAIDLIGQKVAREALKIVAVPTSDHTATQALALKIPLTTIEAVGRLDITIDGADQVELKTLSLIKGLGGALVREKIVAFATDKYVIVVDQSKIAEGLGNLVPVPVEIIRFGWSSTCKHLETLGCQLTMRKGADGELYVSDGGNLIADCFFASLSQPVSLEKAINNIAGVVDCGLFLGLNPLVVIGSAGGARVFPGGRL